MLKRKETYLMPIWIDIECHGNPKDVMIDLNEKLTLFFESYGEKVQWDGNTIDIQWSVNKHVNLRSG